MRSIIYFITSLMLGLFPALTSAKCFTNEILEAKFNDVVFVVYCEDRSDTKAVMLVMSTIYNRAGSHDVNLLQAEVSKKNQYYCFNMKSKNKNISLKEYTNVYNTVCDFVTNERSPITRAKYFYNYKLVSPSFVKTLTPLLTHGSHIYLI
jgi:hypothetical protein